MTPEERERLNNLCKRIEDEQNPKVFNALVEELNELLGATPEPPAEGKKPLQIHRDMMPTHAILRCAYCRFGNEFRTMKMRAQGWFQCESCGHNAVPLDPEFKCTCGRPTHRDESRKVQGRLIPNGLRRDFRRSERALELPCARVVRAASPSTALDRRSECDQSSFRQDLHSCSGFCASDSQ